MVAIPCEKAASGFMYYAYVGRRRLEPFGWFNAEFAIDSVLCDALGPQLWSEVKGV